MLATIPSTAHGAPRRQVLLVARAQALTTSKLAKMRKAVLLRAVYVDLELALALAVAVAVVLALALALVLAR